MQRRIAGALGDAGIEREKIREVMGAMRRVIAEVQSEGDAFKLHPKMLAHLQELGLTDEQIKTVVGLSRRVAGADEGTNRDADTRSDRSGIRERIEGAVERAEMTREEADQLDRQIRERTTGRRDQ